MAQVHFKTQVNIIQYQHKLAPISLSKPVPTSLFYDIHKNKFWDTLALRLISKYHIIISNIIDQQYKMWQLLTLRSNGAYIFFKTLWTIFYCLVLDFVINLKAKLIMFFLWYEDWSNNTFDWSNNTFDKHKIDDNYFCRMIRPPFLTLYTSLVSGNPC